MRIWLQPVLAGRSHFQFM